MRQSGEVVAGFRVERLIGSGGMGEVYLVQHPRLPRLDALKLLPIAASSDPSYRERFQREADLAASLDHDNVVPVYDRGETGGQLWIHMKYVAGQDAAAALASSGPFGVQRALHVITRVAALSTTRTATACCTATSNPRTFSSAPLPSRAGPIGCTSPTSASRRARATRPG